MAVVHNVEQCEVARRLHDHVAEARGIESDLAVVIDSQASEECLDVLPEALERRVEIEETLHRANQILLPDSAERLKREVEQESLRHSGARLKDRFLQKRAQQLAAVYLKVAVYEHAVNVVVQIEG